MKACKRCKYSAYCLPNSNDAFLCALLEKLKMQVHLVMSTKTLGYDYDVFCGKLKKRLEGALPSGCPMKGYVQVLWEGLHDSIVIRPVLYTFGEK